MEDTNIIDVDCEKHQTREEEIEVVFYELNIPNVIGGSVTRSAYASSYREGTPLILTAVPKVGYKFIDWTDGVSTNPLLVKMNSNITKKARFSTLQFELIINHTDTIGGTFTKIPVGNIVDDKTLFKYGTNVTLNATPTPGYKFIGWSGTVNSKNLKFIITMNRNITLTPIFELIEYSLIANVVGFGKVVRSPNQEKYKPTDSIIITAVPDSGYAFVNWTNASKNVISTNPIMSNLKLVANLTITATFDIARFKLTVSSTPNLGGVVRKSSNGVVINDKNYYLPGTTVILTALPNVKYKFERWSGNFQGNESIIDNPVPTLINSDITLQAVFSILRYELKFDISGNGKISTNPKGTVIDDYRALYSINTRIILTPVPDVGWEFSKWISGVISNTKTASIIMKSNSVINAEFRLMQCEIVINVTGSGKVGLDPISYPITGKLLYNYGTIVKLTAIPGMDYQFSNWINTYGTQISTMDELSPITTTTIVSNRTITCVFKITEYELNIVCDDGGTVNYSPTGTIVKTKRFYSLNTLVKITANPSSKYQFDGWSGHLNSRTNPVVVRMYYDMSVVANFSIKRVLLDLSCSENGIVNVSPIAEMVEGKYSFPIDEYITLKPIADPAYRLYTWSGSVSSTEQPLVFSITEDMTIRANFDLIQFELNLTYNPRCSISCSPEGRIVNGKLMYVPQTKINLTAVPATGHYFIHWTGTVGNIYTTNLTLPEFTLTSDRYFVAVFEVVPYDLVVVCNPPLSCNIVQNPAPILRDGELKYLYETPVNITITINFGFLFDGWTGTNINDNNNLSIDIVIYADTLQVANCTVAYQLLMTKDVGGSISKNKVGDMVSGKEMFRTGTVITLTATPIDGYRLVSWEGTNIGPPTIYDFDVTIDKTTIQNANFIVSYELILNVTSGGVIDKSSAGTLDHGRIMYDDNETVTFTPIANAGYRFYSFVGNGITTYFGDNPSYFGPTPKAYSINHHITMQATFIKIFELIATAADANGTITISPIGTIVDGKRMYDDGTIVTLTAYPTDLYELEKWDGSAVYLTRQMQVTMNATITQTAKFIQTYWDLIVNVDGYGTYNHLPVHKPINNRKMYTIGTVVTITPIASINYYVFNGWDDNTFAPLSVLMDRQQIITIKFIQAVAINVINFVSGQPITRVIDHGVVAVDHPEKITLNGQMYVPKSIYFRVTPSADAGYRLSKWVLSDANYYGANTEISISNNVFYDVYSAASIVNVRINFVAAWQLTVVQVVNGSLTYSPAGDNVNNKKYFPPNSNVTLISTPNAGYRCDGWIVNDVELIIPLSASYILAMTADTIIKTKFIAAAKLTITTAAGDTNFTYTLSVAPTMVDEKRYYSLDTSVTITVSFSTNFLCDHLSLSDGQRSDSNAMTFTMNQDLIVYVYSVQTFGLKLTVSIGGTVTRSPVGLESNNLIYYPASQYLKFTATPSPGYLFRGWSHTQLGTNITTNPWNFYVYWENTMIVANFDQAWELKFTVIGGSGCSPQYSPTPDYNISGKIYYVNGRTVTLSVSNIQDNISHGSNRIVGWENEPSNTTKSRTINITGDVTEKVTVAQQIEFHIHEETTYGTLVWSPVPNHSIPGSCSFKYYDYGTVVSVTAQPNSGYIFVWNGYFVGQPQTATIVAGSIYTGNGSGASYYKP